MPIAKDEDGTIIDTNLPEAPPLFPKMNMPGKLPIDAHRKELLDRRNKLMEISVHSPFWLDLKGVEKEDAAALLDAVVWKKDSADAQGPATRKRRMREPLTSVVQMLPACFPGELFTSTDRRLARLQEGYFQRAKQKDDIGLKLDLMAQQEEGGPGKEGEQGKRGEEDGQGDDQEADLVDTDNEEDMDDDDYYQGEEFDDDDGYEDVDDGRDEPYF